MFLFNALKNTSMKSLLLFFALVGLVLPADFKTEQIKKERVKTAYLEKEKPLDGQLKKLGVNLGSLQVYLQAFKHERVIAIWVKNKTDKKYQLLGEMPFCAGSGRLGPKNEQGDRQIPEGFYYINRFHPESKYYLSLGINYPNAADSARNQTGNLGGDIFIHGKCMSVGCIAITDEGIKELYVLTVEAFQNGQVQIPVHIFPAKLTPENMDELEFISRNQPENFKFWKQLKTGYDQFEQYQLPPVISIAENGSYQIEKR